MLQAENGMLVMPEHLYVIPPGAYLSISDGSWHLSTPTVPRGARLPFDFLLQSLAAAYGHRAICVVLSGNGADGTIGLRAVREAGGLVLAQDPAEAEYGGMPTSAIATGLVNQVVRVAAIADALSHRGVKYARTTVPPPDGASAGADPVLAIIALLRARTGHDFTPYKRGTLERRIERRIALAGGVERDHSESPVNPPDSASVPEAKKKTYLARLRTDETELDLLAKDLLIHVTSFFRDPAAFDTLAREGIPGLLHGRSAEQPLRIWVAGCSTGEEAYSLVILFHEAVAAAQHDKTPSSNFRSSPPISTRLLSPRHGRACIRRRLPPTSPPSVWANSSRKRTATATGFDPS